MFWFVRVTNLYFSKQGNVILRHPLINLIVIVVDIIMYWFKWNCSLWTKQWWWNNTNPCNSLYYVLKMRFHLNCLKVLEKPPCIERLTCFKWINDIYTFAQTPETTHCHIVMRQFYLFQKLLTRQMWQAFPWTFTFIDNCISTIN